MFSIDNVFYSGTSLFQPVGQIKVRVVALSCYLGVFLIQRCSSQGVGIEESHCIQRCSSQSVGIEEFHCIQRCPHFRGLE